MVEAVARSLRAEQLRGARAAALVLAVLAGAIAIWHLPGRFRTVDAQVSRFAGVSLAERRLLPARGVDVDTSVYVAASRLIPLGDPYAVVTGPGVTVSTPTTFDAVAPFAGYYLGPRPQVTDPRRARWVISYGGDLARLGVRVRRIVEVGQGVRIAELRP